MGLPDHRLACIAPGQCLAATTAWPILARKRTNACPGIRLSARSPMPRQDWVPLLAEPGSLLAPAQPAVHYGCRHWGISRPADVLPRPMHGPAVVPSSRIQGVAAAPTGSNMARDPSPTPISLDRLAILTCLWRRTRAPCHLELSNRPGPWPLSRLTASDPLGTMRRARPARKRFARARCAGAPDLRVVSRGLRDCANFVWRRSWRRHRSRRKRKRKRFRTLPRCIGYSAA